VEYDNDPDWGEWNRAAKLRILMRPAPPMAQYYVGAARTGGQVTPVSSLAQSSTASTHESRWTVDTRTEAPPTASQLNQQASRHSDSVGTRTKETAMTWDVSPEDDEEARRSDEDSEATIEFKTLKEWNKKHNLTFESASKNAVRCSDGGLDKENKEKKEIKRKVRKMQVVTIIRQIQKD
jgi:hypothetical protein